MASDGVAHFLLSNGAHTIANKGTLRFGFDAPELGGNCTTMFIKSMYIDRCSDANGNGTYTCPKI